jgi:uncharacterized membrane protein YebE (DUF533 family)
MASQASELVKEVIAHMAKKHGVQLRVTIEIAAEFPDGSVDETLRRTISENSRQLGVDFGFEEA